ncbi:MAG: DUF2812 domain-containing protein [Heyndrickxia sp.]
MKKRVFKLFWAWQDDQENKWLEKMAEEGWKLIKYNFLVYTFAKMEPKKYIYKTDFKNNQNHDLQEYLALFEDAGWEHVTQYAGWHYFRTEPGKAKTPDIYSDSNSKMEMFRRLLWFLLMPLMGIIIIACTIVFNDSFSQIKLMIVLKIVYVVLICLLGFSVLNILYKMKRLKE